MIKNSKRAKLFPCQTFLLYSKILTHSVTCQKLVGDDWWHVISTPHGKCILQNIVDKQLSTAAKNVVVSVQLKVTETTGSSECRKSRHLTETRQHLIGTMKNQVRNHKINCNYYFLISNHVKGSVE